MIAQTLTPAFLADINTPRVAQVVYNTLFKQMYFCLQFKRTGASLTQKISLKIVTKV